MGDPNKSFKPSQVPQHHTNAHPGPHQAMNPQPIHQKMPVTNSQQNAGVPQNSQQMTPDHSNQQKQGKFQTLSLSHFLHSAKANKSEADKIIQCKNKEQH